MEYLVTLTLECLNLSAFSEFQFLPFVDQLFQMGPFIEQLLLIFLNVNIRLNSGENSRKS